MHPSRPHHTVSAHYRKPGGLRALDFFADKIESHAEIQGGTDYTILVVENGDAQSAVPFAAMGYAVTSLHSSDQAMHFAQAAAVDVGLDVNCLVGSAEDVPAGTYDAIVFPDGFLPADDTALLLASLHGKLKPGGRLFIQIKSLNNKTSEGFSKLLFKLRSAGWRPWDACTASILLNRVMKRFGSYRIGRRRLFHFLDSFDGHLSDLLPRVLADGWLMELGAFSQDPLALQLVPTLSLGGAEKVAFELSRSLPADGYQTVLLANVAGGPLCDFAHSCGIRTHVLDRVHHGGRWGSFWQLRRLISDLKPEVVHTHLFAADLWGRLAARLAGVKNMVTTVHNVHNDHGFVGRLAMILLKRLSQKYVAVSKDVAECIIRDWHVPATKVSVIYNGINIERIHRRPSQPFHDVPRLLFVGRLESQKNPDVLLRALAGIRRPWHLQIYGTGSMRPYLVNLADELGIAPRITWGSVVDISDVYAEQDVFIFPSRYEGLGLAAIEAAVAGLPIITSRLAPLEELFKEDEVIFVPPNDTETLSRAVQTVLDNPSLSTSRGLMLAGKDWSLFSAERMSAAYASVYRQLKV